jgi:hypothetical protein
MKNPTMDEAGQLHCWNCGCTSFTSKRTGAAKFAVGVGALLTAKKLKCNACGSYSAAGSTAPGGFETRAAAGAVRGRERLAAVKAERAENPPPSFKESMAANRAKIQAKKAAKAARKAS